MDIALGALYSEEAVARGMTHREGRHDVRVAAVPDHARVCRCRCTTQIRERDADFYERLEQAGFQHDWGEDDSGLFMKYLRRASGYYIDVGASELVANGDIKLQPGQVDHLTEDAVVLADGTELPADLVVYATGYESMNGFVADLISQEVADKVGKVWGLGSDTTKDPGPWEGEQRNMWKPTQQEGLWFHGGNLHQSRHYSLYLALQLKARAGGDRDAGLRPTGRSTTCAEPKMSAERPAGCSELPAEGSLLEMRRLSDLAVPAALATASALAAGHGIRRGLHAATAARADACRRRSAAVWLVRAWAASRSTSDRRGFELRAARARSARSAHSRQR